VQLRARRLKAASHSVLASADIFVGIVTPTLNGRGGRYSGLRAVYSGYSPGLVFPLAPPSLASFAVPVVDSDSKMVDGNTSGGDSIRSSALRIILSTVGSNLALSPAISAPSRVEAGPVFPVRVASAACGFGSFGSGLAFDSEK